MDHVNIVSVLSKEEKDKFWKAKRKSFELFLEYTQVMSITDNNGIINEKSIRRFCDLFLPTATVWNDIHYEPFPVNPMDYAIFVNNFTSKGVIAEAKQIGNYADSNDKRYLRFYPIGENNSEYYIHTAFEKKIYFALNKEMKEFNFGKNPKNYKLDFVVYINTETDVTKIADIKPLLN